MKRSRFIIYTLFQAVCWASVQSSCYITQHIYLFAKKNNTWKVSVHHSWFLIWFSPSLFCHLNMPRISDKVWECEEIKSVESLPQIHWNVAKGMRRGGHTIRLSNSCRKLVLSPRSTDDRADLSLNTKGSLNQDVQREWRMDFLTALTNYSRAKSIVKQKSIFLLKPRNVTPNDSNSRS